MREIRAYGSVGAPEGNLRRYPAGLGRGRGGLVSTKPWLLASTELNQTPICWWKAETLIST